MKIYLPAFTIILGCFVICGTQPAFSQLTCIDSALSFSGDNQYLKLPSNSFSQNNFLSQLTSDYTIECLINWKDGADFQRVFDFSYGSTYFMFLTTSENTNHVPRFAISTTGLNAPQIVDANTALTPNVFHHLAVTYSKANSLITVFIDGVAVGSGSVNIDADAIYFGDDRHDSSANYIGLSSFASDPQLNADIDELRISNVVRYTGNFSPTVPFTPDANTIALYHFDSSGQQIAHDASGNNYSAQLGSTADVDVNDPTWISCTGVLATPLMNFTATAVKAKVQLNWKTASEINTNYFEIQRSTNGINFVTAGKVKAVNNGMGNSYSFTDASPANGKNYYRLKEVDVSGSSIYSSIVFVQLNSNNNFRIFPTLVTDHLHITITQTPATVIIYNTMGKPVKTINLNSVESDINVSSLPAGTYIIRNTTSNSALKFIKQ